MINFIDLVSNSALNQFENVVKYEDKENGFFCYIKKMTSMERDAWEIKISKLGGQHKTKNKPSDDERLERVGSNFRARYLAEVISDEKGNLIAKGKEQDIGNMSAKIVSKLFEFARDVNGLTEEDMDELEKN